jgi:hypothetical protein
MENLVKEISFQINNQKVKINIKNNLSYQKSFRINQL